MIRCWMVGSSLFAAALAAGTALAGAAALGDPEWFEGLCREASKALARLPAALGRPAPSEGAEAPPGEAPAEPLAAGEPREPAAPDLEEKLARLETEVALLQAVPGRDPLPERARTAVSRLEAWERLREPIFAAIAAFAAEGAEGSLPARGADIREIAGELARRLECAARARTEARSGVAGALGAREIVLLALAGGASSDEAAVERVLGLPPREAAAALRRLAVLRPDLTARVLSALRGTAAGRPER